MVRRGEFCATLKKVRFCGILYVTNDSFKCYIKVGEPMGENKTPQELDFERKHEEYLHRIQNLRLIDDNFMTKVFEDKECSEFLLQVILDRDDLTIREVHSQYGLNNIQGRSARLDILAVDEQNKAYNIEIQRNDRGAEVRRARYNSGLMDANITEPGDRYDQLYETYVIFITENDILKAGLPIYHIERTIQETGMPFGDGAHIIYVNSQIKDDTKLGRLMQDFTCTNPDDMNYPVLAQRVRYFKEDTKGVATMYCEPLRLVCFEDVRLVLPERSMESNTRMNSFDKLAQSSIVHPRLSSSDGEISILITFLPSGLPLLIFSANFLCTSIIRPYIASGEILSGKRLALTISAFSLLMEYLMAFAPCDMVEAFAIITNEGIYSVR